jgi:hypothetical protein
MPSSSQTEQKLHLRTIYVNGMPRTSYKILKQHLFSLHFMLSKIKNISYIAKNCVEFLVDEDYASTFITKCKICQLQIIEVDPTKPLDPNFPVANLPEVQKLFANRLSKIVESTNSDLVRSFYTRYATERGISLPLNAVPTTTETAPTETSAANDTTMPDVEEVDAPLSDHE